MPAIASMLCILVLGLLVAGCGDDEDAVGDAGGETADAIEAGDLSKTEFIEDGNAICRKATKKIGAAFQSLSRQKGDPEEAKETLANAAIEALQDEIDGLTGLGAPAGEEEDVARVLAAMGQMQSVIEAEPRDLNQASGSAKKAEKAADEYGLKACPFS